VCRYVGLGQPCALRHGFPLGPNGLDIGVCRRPGEDDGAPFPAPFLRMQFFRVANGMQGCAIAELNSPRRAKIGRASERVPKAARNPGRATSVWFKPECAVQTEVVSQDCPARTMPSLPCKQDELHEKCSGIDVCSGPLDLVDFPWSFGDIPGP